MATSSITPRFVSVPDLRSTTHERQKKQSSEQNRRVSSISVLVIMTALYAMHRMDCKAWQETENEITAQLKTAKQQDEQESQNFRFLHEKSCKTFEGQNVPEFCQSKQIPVKIDSIPLEQRSLKEAAKKANAARDHLTRQQARYWATLTKQPLWCPKR